MLITFYDKRTHIFGLWCRVALTPRPNVQKEPNHFCPITDRGNLCSSIIFFHFFSPPTFVSPFLFHLFICSYLLDAQKILIREVWMLIDCSNLIGHVTHESRWPGVAFMLNTWGQRTRSYKDLCFRSIHQIDVYMNFRDEIWIPSTGTTCLTWSAGP